MESDSEVKQGGSSSNSSTEVIPKKPTTAYGFFKQQRRSEMEKANVHRPFVDFSAECRGLWNKMTEMQKSPFIDLATKDNKDKKRRKEMIKNFDPSQGDETKKRKRDPLAPKAPRSSYIWFCQDIRPLFREQRPDLQGADIFKEMGRIWQAMEEADKMQYHELYEKDKRRFDQEMEIYKGNQRPSKHHRVEENTTDGEIFIERVVEKNQLPVETVTEEGQIPVEQNPVSMCEALLAILSNRGNHSTSTPSSQETSFYDSSLDDE